MADLDLRPFEDEVRSVHRRALVLPAMMLLLGVTFFFIPPPEEAPWLSIAVGSSLCALTAYLLYLFLRPPAAHPAIRVLRERRADVVWFYPKHILRGGRHVASAFMLRTTNRKTFQVPIPVKVEASLEAALRAAMPRATSGYDGNLEAKFRADPRSLFR